MNNVILSPSEESAVRTQNNKEDSSLALRMTDDNVTVDDILREARITVDMVDARMLLCHSLGVRREYLATHPDRLLTETEATHFNTLVARRASGEPVAYLVGSREFYGRDFSVTPAVLIPRPETELLVDLALARMPQRGRCEALDLGTGSGAIAITLACERPAARIFAVDASQAALDVASGNASSLLGSGWASRLTLLHGDWYGPLIGRRFDVIVANPPYVEAGDPHLAQGDLRFEPAAALTPGGDGLGALRVIVAGAPAHLVPGGWLICEHGYDQAAEIQALFRAAGLNDVTTVPDLAGIPRATLGRRAMD